MSADKMPILARECAAKVGTSISCLYRMARRNIIPCHRVGVSGRGVRFVVREVREALQNRPAWDSNKKAYSEDIRP